MANPGDVNFMMMDPEQSIPATKVELTVSARKLLDMDVFSKSDPRKEILHGINFLNHSEEEKYIIC